MDGSSLWIGTTIDNVGTVPRILLLVRLLAGQVLRILMHPLPEGRLHAGSQRYDAVLAVLLADLIHGRQRPAPILGAGLVDETGLPFARLERLRVDSQQADRLSGPGDVKQAARRRSQLRVDLRGMVERSRARERRKVGVAQLDLHGARPQAMIAQAPRHHFG